MKSSRIKSISLANQKVSTARAGDSISIELTDDVDISRGAMIVPLDASFIQAQSFTAVVTWMDEQPMVTAKSYLLQHGINRVKAKVVAVQSVLDITTMDGNKEKLNLGLNDIGKIAFKTAKPIFADLYKDNPQNGSFILIDEFTNNTVAVGMIESF